ncbi:hypothetical protein FB446DRAFT_709932 [Lentinula raphanica]|nr:hypothetical protein FB446DRAFT_709932 [Lentinula raphanica]
MHTWEYREMREGQSLIDEKRALSCYYEAITFNLRSQNSGSSQEFAGNFLTIFLSKPFGPGSQEFAGKFPITFVSKRFVSRLVLLHAAATVGMLTILASPVLSGTQGPGGTPLYLVMVDKGTVDQRVYFSLTVHYTFGLQYDSWKTPPGRIESPDIGEPILFPPNNFRTRHTVWINIGFAHMEDDKVEPVANKLLEDAKRVFQDKVKSRDDHEEFEPDDDFVYSLDRLRALYEEVKAVDLNTKVLKQEAEEYKISSINTRRTVRVKDHVEKVINESLDLLSSIKKRSR